ncbi:MAG: hypothetical protein HYW24_04045 [Candidatus Aenigmarchaeota archaeon]|nr:hypothetical protein [Candidatus Aenigmarchaeota archaeon]
MELNKVEDNDKRMIVEFEDESIAFANMVKDVLWEDASIKEAAVIREHPYLSKPKILVVTSRGSPKTALEKATGNLLDKTKEFKEELKGALK